MQLRFYYYAIDPEYEKWLYVVAHTYEEANNLINQWNKYRHINLKYAGTSLNFRRIEIDENGKPKLGKIHQNNKAMKERLNEDFFKNQCYQVRKENENFAARINHDR